MTIMFPRFHEIECYFALLHSSRQTSTKNHWIIISISKQFVVFCNLLSLSRFCFSIIFRPNARVQLNNKSVQPKSDGSNLKSPTSPVGPSPDFSGFESGLVNSPDWGRGSRRNKLEQIGRFSGCAMQNMSAQVSVYMNIDTVRADWLGSFNVGNANGESGCHACELLRDIPIGLHS